MRNVHIVGTGGTIASTTDPDTGAAVPALSAEDLREQVPGLDDLADIDVTEFAQVNSWDMTPALMVQLSTVVADLLDGDTHGVVITHGTDTMEETAFVLELLLGARRRTVVLTGAMRNASQDGPDGPRNLLAAARVASSPACADLGSVVVLNGQIHAARYVTKTHTTALDTFRSPDTGPLGTVDDIGPLVRWRPALLPPIEVDRLRDVDEPAVSMPDVHLVTMAAGHDDLLLRAALDAGSSGVVIEASGSGNVVAQWQSAVRALIDANVPVVLASRCGSGRVVPGYGGDGGGHTLVELGVVPAGDLPGPKARLALLLLLSGGADVAAVRRWFADLSSTPR
ncbi:asparaginase [soil metagenome]